MIQIIKGVCPKNLSKKGRVQTTKLKTKFSRNQAGYLNGTPAFDNFKVLYKSKAVVKELKTNQHNKCCFSESIFAFDYPHVEHFRPKGRVDEWPTGSAIYPGYYWLCYDWDNLLLCKSIINSSFKRNYFPLLPGSTRNRSHHDKNTELPVLIDPSVDNPRDHIRFKGDEPVGITDRGKKTIEILNLRHPDFEEARRKKLVLIKLLKEFVDLAIARGVNKADPTVAESITQLRLEMQPEAEFSSMTIDFLSEWPHLV